MSTEVDIELVQEVATREIRRLRGVAQRRAEAIREDMNAFLSHNPKTWHFFGSVMESERLFDRAQAELDGWIQAAKLVGIENP